MKKTVLIISFLLAIVKLYSQTNENSKVNVYVPKTGINALINPSFELFLNDEAIHTFGGGERLTYEISSTGKLKVLVNILVKGKDYRYSVINLDIEKGKEYYIHIVNAPFAKAYLEENTIGKRVFEKTKNFKKELITKKEDHSNPIIKDSKKSQNTVSKSGSGFLINKDGYIITNFHVIEDANKVKVKGIKGDLNTDFEAKIISVDRQTDLALLKVESKLFSFSNPPYILKNSKEVNKAEKIFALGYPIKSALGREVKITDGIINSYTGYKSSISEFQISAAIQGGNSGGPLFNSNGELIGVVSAKIVSEAVDQVGYAIKSNYLNYFLTESGITEFTKHENQLSGKDLPEQVRLISDFVYIIETE